MSEKITVTEFAKRIGKSHVWVLKLIKAGVIPRGTDGKIPYEEAITAYNAKYGEGVVRTRKTQSNAIVNATDDDELFRSAKQSAKMSTALNQAKLAEKTFSAKLKELDYKLKKGELLERSAVAAEASELADAVKLQLLAIPPRVSSLCEGRIAREIEEIITDAINDALKTLQKFEVK